LKKPVMIMLSIIASIVLLCILVVGGYFYVKHQLHPAKQKPLTAAQQAALQVAFPQATTNLESDGLIQFTMVVQATDKDTKTEITQLMPDIQDLVNRAMLGFTADALKQTAGFDKLKASIMASVNQELPSGKVTKVDFSQIVIQ
jgi:flagellar protein FliL